MVQLSLISKAQAHCSKGKAHKCMKLGDTFCLHTQYFNSNYEFDLNIWMSPVPPAVERSKLMQCCNHK